ncbi:LOW QUALITY PROTEIN: hypothetical protein BC936DRAFT_136694, partial [Jimgerdemannia flammicorona]
YNARYNCILSADTSGIIEYWDPEEPFELPKNVAFEYKSDTDLFEFKKLGPLSGINKWDPESTILSAQNISALNLSSSNVYF